MLYTKYELKSGKVVEVPLYDDEIYARCCVCQQELIIEREELAWMIEEGVDFQSNITCGDCTERKEKADNVVFLKTGGKHND